MRNRPKISTTRKIARHCLRSSVLHFFPPSRLGICKPTIVFLNSHSITMCADFNFPLGRRKGISLTACESRVCAIYLTATKPVGNLTSMCANLPVLDEFIPRLRRHFRRGGVADNAAFQRGRPDKLASGVGQNFARGRVRGAADALRLAAMITTESSKDSKTKYPKIKVATVLGSGNQLAARILAERRGEKFLPDVVSSGANTCTMRFTKPSSRTDQARAHASGSRGSDPNGTRASTATSTRRSVTFLPSSRILNRGRSFTTLNKSIRRSSNPTGIF